MKIKMYTLLKWKMSYVMQQLFELTKYSKYNKLPNLADDFNLIYNEILEYCKDIKKTIVIDCAQFHC